MRAIVIIPTYNEKENIINIIDAIFKVKDDMDILVVDDNSPDGTSDLVNERKQKDNRVHLISRPGKMGLGTAYCDGFRYCLENGFDAIFEMDADFSHDPKEIPNFLKEIKENDLVIGSRYLTGVNVVNWPLRRLILSYGASFYTRIITGLKIKDPTGGFKCFKAEALRKIDLSQIKSNGYGFQIEMNYRMWKSGAKIKEIPIIFIDRRSGVSKMNKQIIKEAVFMVWRLRFSFGSIYKKK
jgi:dolichol-phosphate mannosyltransferase